MSGLGIGGKEGTRRTITKVPMTRMSRHVDILDSSRGGCYFLIGSGSECEYGLAISTSSDVTQLGVLVEVLGLLRGYWILPLTKGEEVW